MQTWHVDLYATYSMQGTNMFVYVVTVQRSTFVFTTRRILMAVRDLTNAPTYFFVLSSQRHSHSNQITNVDATSFVLRLKNNLKMRQKQTSLRRSLFTKLVFWLEQRRPLFFLKTLQTYRLQPTASCAIISFQKHVSCTRASPIL